MSDRKKENEYDVVVVGGGAAGLNAALVLARADRRIAVVDGKEPRNAPAAHLHAFLANDGAPRAAFFEEGRIQLTGYGVELIEGQVDHIAPGFSVRLQGGQTMRTRQILMATGLRDELPEIPGVRERWGRDLLHCPYCHGYEVRGQPLGVLGTGPGSVGQALLLRQWSDDVVLLPGKLDVTEEERLRLTARGVQIMEGRIERLVVDDDRLRGVELAEGHVVPRAVVFVFPRMVPRDELLFDLDCARDANGWLITDRAGRTSVPGVWAAGNVVDPRALAVTAAGMGAAAAFAINHDLVDDEVGRAVAAFRDRNPER
ncbi:NAD(P)/FAD-dependent oxidoreductase [Nocardia donostiensis]|uniref:Thioredoxin reductase n=1 Tax=Nocardia donostiensis TaxID=1538463 RepID=A0A1W0AUC3_9NOCA|nr:NAD(P)/FAD-dependent oxidoreductase [Nocardia donostiensis]ONM48178.1 thioredoxin reductase [Nocardia donostiensis]OQS13830.1 thioredoxin reductase [Nocardia donostiensis]OQS16035.1 thioredoxin reductase [Nocardia donostiensis]